MFQKHQPIHVFESSINKSQGGFQNFSISQILREINFVASRSAKHAIFAILGAMDFVQLVNFSFEKEPNF